MGTSFFLLYDDYSFILENHSERLYGKIKPPLWQMYKYTRYIIFNTALRVTKRCGQSEQISPLDQFQNCEKIINYPKISIPTRPKWHNLIFHSM